MVGSMRSTVIPGVSIGTKTMEWRAYRCALGSVRPMKMITLQSRTPHLFGQRRVFGVG
ncbi:Uncharacterised protein [Mycobacteroides abscessus subsp. abscessus]|nr:Uncharacterised protein [Mycobacteroides abscessus subsp. abscessus]